jgi:RHS repeat-associated protein
MPCTVYSRVYFISLIQNPPPSRLSRSLTGMFIAAAALFMLGLAAPRHAEAQTYYWIGGNPGYDGCNSSGCPSALSACQSYADDNGGAADGEYIVEFVQIGTYRYTCAVGYHAYGVGPVYLVCPGGTYPDIYSGTGCDAEQNQQMVGQKIGTSSGASSCPCNTAGQIDDSRDKSDPVQLADNVGGVALAAPVDVATGNVFYQVTDYSTAGQNPLSFTRYYNSRGANQMHLGSNWSSNFTSYIVIVSSSQVILHRASGQVLTFNLSGSTWSTDSDMDVKMTTSGSNYLYTDHDDTVEAYSNSNWLLQSRIFRNGYTQTMSYTSGELTSVTDSYGRTLTFTWNTDKTIASVTTPDGTTITYGYTVYGGGEDLTSVTYPTSPSSTVTYTYTTSLPYNELTQITDENGNNFLSWTYDSFGRALTSQKGNGSTANVTTFSYNDTAATTTVTNALGVADTYTITRLVGIPKISGISRAATSTTAAATASFTYDSNGYLASKVDWNGNTTTYTNNSYGARTQIVEASGTSIARTTTIAYDSTCVHLPDSITTSGLTTSFTYDSSCDVLTTKLTDTTTTSVPYSTNGQTRTWTNTWSSGLLATQKTPNGNTTTFGYNSNGALTSIKNALTQTTNITSVTTGGRPLTVVDPNGSTNGTTTTYTYDARQRLTSKAVAQGGTTETWTYTLDPASQLTKVTYPDSSYLSYAYDTAHRVTKATNALGEYQTYTLDDLGDQTQVNNYNSSGTLSRQVTYTFDALGRELTRVGGSSLDSFTYTYDANGNRLTIKDGNSHTTTNVYDALNRLHTSTDANSGVTTYAYDPHDRLLTVTDPNSNSTSFVRDGFEDAIQQVSPDTGTSVYYYDSDANLTQKVDGASVTVNATYDALDRITAQTYPADTTQNVTYGYDQTSGSPYSNNEIGRLSYIVNPVGRLIFAYDGFGNVNHREQQGPSPSYTDLTDVYFTYTLANLPASVTYPSGLYVQFNRDAAGQLTTVQYKPPGGSSNITVETASYAPFFGPQLGATSANTIEVWKTPDQDYRTTTYQVENTTSSTYFANQTRSYDQANNLTGITDSATASNSQTLGYDVINRLTSATSGTGGYGTQSFTYDANGNLTQKVAGGTTYAYTYASGTNQLTGSTWPSNTETMTYNGNGNLTGITLNSSTAYTGAYNVANRLSSESASGGTAISGIVYDGRGLRYSKQDSGGSAITYAYDEQGHLVEENNGGTVVDYIYDNDLLAGLFLPASSTLYYVHTDPLGTPLFVTNSTKAQVWSAQYQPYGTTTPSGSITLNVRLPGQYYDSEVALSYNTMRDYSAAWGRYIEADPIGLRGGLNPYRYASANPLRFMDPAGTDPQSIWGNPGQVIRSVGASVCYFLGVCSVELPESSSTSSETVITQQGQTGPQQPVSAPIDPNDPQGTGAEINPEAPFPPSQTNSMVTGGGAAAAGGGLGGPPPSIPLIWFLPGSIEEIMEMLGLACPSGQSYQAI